MNSQTHTNHTSASLVQKLVCHISRKPADLVKLEYRNALQVLNCSFINFDSDEFTICEKIKKKFMLDERFKDALTFVELYRKLQSTSVLKNKASVLHLLYCLYGFGSEKLDMGQCVASCPKLGTLNSDPSLKVHDIINRQINKSCPNTVDLTGQFLKNPNKDPVTDMRFLKYMNKPNIYQDNLESIPTRVSQVAAMFATSTEKHYILPSSLKQEYLNTTKATEECNSHHADNSLTKNLRPVLRDILYVIQGLRGDLIFWEPEKNNFNVSFKEDFPNPIKRLTLRFVELGWMYYRINEYCTSESWEKSHGLLAQSFVAALKSKLIDYYKLIAELEAFLLQEISLEHLNSNSNSLTLHKLSVWLFEPHMQLKILASVVDACRGKKGGALASILYSHLQHGDYYVRELIQYLLQVATQPLFKMLSSWIFCGELEDPFGEFLVATNIGISDVCLWQEKYCLNKSMIPSFITMEQARKILSTGKAINFLRQVCQDNTFVRDEQRRIKALELMSTESLFSHEKGANFESILEKNYVRTSKIVLQVLHEKYNLMDHLLAMRNYFLLGQGDFIRHLMDLLDADLAKPVKNVYIHNITGVLESAIRATNAQFHNPEVLQRLDVRLLDISVIGDTGWDVFTLDYHAGGPIGTVFTPHCMNSYVRLFTALWRAKRMEFILNKISQSRATYLKWQTRIPEVTPVLHQCHITLAQMVHFVQQMEYYMAFEVMECCWADLLLKISSAQDLDQVIAAHENFLDTLLTRALLDEESLILRTQLKAIYDLIIDFDKIQSLFWNHIKEVVEKLNDQDELNDSNVNSETWSICAKQKKEYNELIAVLKSKHIPTTKAELKILSHSYEDMVQKFLIMLNDQDDPNLRFLSFRLDFNEHFKRKNSRLQTSLTYQNRRKSIK